MTRDAGNVKLPYENAWITSRAGGIPRRTYHTIHVFDMASSENDEIEFELVLCASADDCDGNDGQRFVDPATSVSEESGGEEIIETATTEPPITNEPTSPTNIPTTVKTTNTTTSGSGNGNGSVVEKLIVTLFDAVLLIVSRIIHK